MRLTKVKNHKKAIPENTIPLINVVFLMLIFFLIAGTVAPPVSTELQPPRSEELPLMPPAGNAVEILSDGTLIHRGEKMSLEGIIARFPAPVSSSNDLNTLRTGAAKQTSDGDDIVHILADRGLQASLLMPVLQAFRAAGHRNVRLVTIRGGA